MRYEHQPRPLTESHHHVRDLIETQEKKANDRTYHKDKEKAREERNDLIKDAKPYVLADFYCYTCREDFKAQAIKETYVDWTCPTQLIAFYRSKCFDGHWCIRYITDKESDPYWMNSLAVALDRGKHYKDIIQPFETGYNLLYGK